MTSLRSYLRWRRRLREAQRAEYEAFDDDRLATWLLNMVETDRIRAERLHWRCRFFNNHLWGKVPRPEKDGSYWCFRGQHPSDRCNNCGGFHNPRAIVICTVTRRPPFGVDVVER